MPRGAGAVEQKWEQGLKYCGKGDHSDCGGFGVETGDAF
jgi:hypothetical protein